MATHTHLSRDDIAAIAKVYRLGDVQSFDVIEAGTINSNFALHTAAGRYALRVNEGKSEADVRYETELVDALSEAGVRTPKPIRTRQGEGFALYNKRLVSVFPWVTGAHRQLGEVSCVDVAQVGAHLARTHLAAAALTPRAGVYQFHDIARRAAALDGNDSQLADAVDAIKEEFKWQGAREAIRNAATQGIIHGDLFRDNVLFDGADLSGLIDFEQASGGSMAYDLAVCINAWCYVESFDFTLVKGLLSGYVSQRPLSPGDRAALYTETRAAAMRFTVTRITDVHLPAPQANPGDKDFRRYLSRLLELRALGADAFMRLSFESAASPLR